MSVNRTEQTNLNPSAASLADAAVEYDDAGEVIKPTDIVFDCPHCGHNHAIDYRGAGLEINCVECGQSMLVPIPDGMSITDLDLSAGELMTQLTQTRILLTKREQQVAELEQTLESMKTRRTELERYRLNTLHRYAELVTMCQAISKAQTDISATISRMLTLIAEEQQR